MGYRQAQRLQDRVNLDRIVRIRRFTTISSVTGNYIGPATTDEQVWCLRRDTETELNIGSDGTVLVFPSTIIVRWDARLESLSGQRVTVTYPEDPSEQHDITNAEPIGRQRFLRLEVEA